MDREDESLADIGFDIFAFLGQVSDARFGPSCDVNTAETLRSIDNEGDRFRIWATSTGLLIPGHGSLDYRVRDVDSVSDALHSFLADLKENFEEVVVLFPRTTISPDSPNDEEGYGSDSGDVLQVLLESIKDIIDRLFRLATKLRSPVTRLRSSRAQRFQIIDDGINLFDCYEEFDQDFVASSFRLAQGISKGSGNDEIAASQDTISKSAVDGELSNYLIKRLTHANVARRRQFAYWQHHHLKLDRHTQAAVMTRDHLRPTNTPISVSDPVLGHQVLDGINHAMTISTATQVPQLVTHNSDLISLLSVSEYMPSPLEQDDNVVMFPPPPRIASEDNFFECPYCFTTCARKTANVKAWHAHLIHDLRPYVCTHDSCKIPNQLYDIKADWIRHEVEEHTSAWKCSLHPEQRFPNVTAYENHLKDEHAETPSTIGETLEATTTQLPEQLQRACPVCTRSVTSQSQFYDHVAAHLVRLAMFSLPRWANNIDANNSNHKSDEAQDDEEDTRDIDLSTHLSLSDGDLSETAHGGVAQDGSILNPRDLQEIVSVDPELQPNQSLSWIRRSLESDADPEHSVIRIEEAREEVSLGDEAGYEIQMADYQDEVGHHHRIERDPAEKWDFHAYLSQKQKSGDLDIVEGNILSNFFERVNSMGSGSLIDLRYDIDQILIEIEANPRLLNAGEWVLLMKLAHYETAPPSDPCVAPDTVRMLSKLYVKAGKLIYAEKELQRAIPKYEASMGRLNGAVIELVEYLGQIYSLQNKLDQAEEWLGLAAVRWEVALGGRSSFVLKALIELGKLHYKQTRPNDADQNFQKMLVAYDGLHSPRPIKAIELVQELGSIYAREGRLQDAEQMWLKALSDWSESAGAEHEMTLKCAETLGALYSKQHRHEVAESMYLKALSGYRAIHPKHPSVTSIAFGLGDMYLVQGRLANADSMFIVALAGYDSSSGIEHELVLDRIRTLGKFYSNQDRTREVEELFVKALSGYEASFLRSTVALGIIFDLGNLYQNQDRLQEAEQTFLRALRGHHVSAGDGHNYTIKCVESLVEIYLKQHRLKEAENLLKMMIDTYEINDGANDDQALRLVRLRLQLRRVKDERQRDLWRSFAPRAGLGSIDEEIGALDDSKSGSEID